MTGHRRTNSSIAKSLVPDAIKQAGGDINKDVTKISDRVKKALSQSSGRQTDAK